MLSRAGANLVKSRSPGSVTATARVVRAKRRSLEAFFQGLHGVTHRRTADAEPDCRLGEAALFRDDGKHR